MTQKSLNPVGIFILTVCLGFASCDRQISETKRTKRNNGSGRPNVILIMTDDQGYGDLHCHGNEKILTHNLDQLYGVSVRFTNFHVDPTCSPTRAALLTGRYSHRTGVWHTVTGRQWMRHDEVTMADVFRSNGYRTGVFGKWHLGVNYPFRPNNRGFHEAVIPHDGTITQMDDYWNNDRMNDTYYHNGYPEQYRGFCTDVFFDESMRFILEDPSAPFFVYLPTSVPHGPWNVPTKWIEPYLEAGVDSNLAHFWASISRADYNLGRLRTFLKKNNLEKNTILIFMTDNGSTSPTFNAGMRGAKGSIYEGGHRVPFFLHYPDGGYDEPVDISELTAHIDVLPTLIGLCGLDFRPLLDLDGTSLVSLLEEASWPGKERTIMVESQRIPYPEKRRRCAVMTDK